MSVIFVLVMLLENTLNYFKSSEFFFQKTHGQINDFIASITVIDSIRGTVKGKQQRVLKGPRGVTMLLGILATQSLRYTGMLCQFPY